MRIVLQRVSKAMVRADGKLTGAIGPGLLIFAGVDASDSEEDIAWMANKIPQLRVFEDAEGKMNLNVKEVGGRILVVSQFTLFGNAYKGTRPSYNHAAPPAVAIPLYEKFLEILGLAMGEKIPAGLFGAYMEIEALHDGPVTLFFDTKNKKL